VRSYSSREKRTRVYTERGTGKREKKYHEESQRVREREKQGKPVRNAKGEVENGTYYQKLNRGGPLYNLYL
jgi:hypothetical protein